MPYARAVDRSPPEFRRNPSTGSLARQAVVGVNPLLKSLRDGQQGPGRRATSKEPGRGSGLGRLDSAGNAEPSNPRAVLIRSGLAIGYGVPCPEIDFLEVFVVDLVAADDVRNHGKDNLALRVLLRVLAEEILGDRNMD